MSGPAVPTSPFADRLISRVRELGHPLCVGLDPHPDRLPACFQRKGVRRAGRAAATEEFCNAVLDRVAGRVAVVKPQIAFFEAMGWQGLQALERIVAGARERGLLVIVDAKRGDVGSTSDAYAAGFLAPGAPFACDAMTVNPYLGLDALEPYIEAAERAAAGVFVLVRTSNPGAADLQELDCGGRPVYDRAAAMLARVSDRLQGPASGFSGIGVVAGATWPSEAARIREILPQSLFLVPGFGEQGASARDAVAGFRPGPDGRLEGGVVSASRSILFPDVASGSRAAWEEGVDQALARAIDDLQRAIAPVG